MLDFMGNELIKYEIVSIISETPCTSDYERFLKHKMKNEIIRAHCVVKSEYGAILEQTTYWSESDWTRNKRHGFYYAQDEALLEDC